MRLLRIFLQLLILAFFLPILVLILMQRPLQLGTLIAAFGLFLFMLLMTLLLGEYTTQRIDPRRDISHKVLGAFIGFAGSALLLLAWLIVSNQYHPTGRRGQLLMLIIEWIGPWLPALVFALLGLQMLRFAWRALLYRR